MKFGTAAVAAGLASCGQIGSESPVDCSMNPNAELTIPMTFLPGHSEIINRSGHQYLVGSDAPGNLWVDRDGTYINLGGKTDGDARTDRFTTPSPEITYRDGKKMDYTIMNIVAARGSSPDVMG